MQDSWNVLISIIRKSYNQLRIMIIIILQLYFNYYMAF